MTTNTPRSGVYLLPTFLSVRPPNAKRSLVQSFVRVSTSRYRDACSSVGTNANELQPTWRITSLVMNYIRCFVVAQSRARARFTGKGRVTVSIDLRVGFGVWNVRTCYFPNGRVHTIRIGTDLPFSHRRCSFGVPYLR